MLNTNNGVTWALGIIYIKRDRVFLSEKAVRKRKASEKGRKRLVLCWHNKLYIAQSILNRFGQSYMR